MRYFRVSVFVLLMCVSAGLFGQLRRGTAGVKFKIHHGANLTVDADPLTDNAAKNEFFVPHDSDVTVVIENANPILYKYELKDLKQEQTVTAGALEDLGAALKTLSGGFAALQAGRQEMTNEAGQREVMATEATAPKKIVCKESDVKGLTAFLDVTREIARAAGRVEQLTKNSYDSPDAVRTEAEAWKIADWQERFDTAYEQLSAEAIRILGGENLPCEGRVALALTKAADIREALVKLKTFQGLALKLNKPLELKTFTVDRSQFTTFKINVAKTDAFPKSVPPAERFFGERSIRVNPEERVKVAPLAGAVYSWVESAEYAAVASGEKFMIQETDSDTTGFALEAGVEFAPRSWDFGGFDGVIQLGVAPKDDLGIFLGLGLKTGKYSFGAGLAMHQVDVLSGGLNVGQEIATKDDLKTDKEFKSGPYVFFSFKP
jgi:hypothetical protein